MDKQLLALMAAGASVPPALEPGVADECSEQVAAAALQAGVPSDRALFTSRPSDVGVVVTYCKAHEVWMKRCLCLSNLA